MTERHCLQVSERYLIQERCPDLESAWNRIRDLEEAIEEMPTRPYCAGCNKCYGVERMIYLGDGIWMCEYCSQGPIGRSALTLLDYLHS